MRYIDADAFKQKLADKDIFFPALYKNELDDIPTADVVPKSEVERLQAEVDQLHALLECGVFANSVEDWQKFSNEKRAEVAREIFAEIEKIRAKEIHKCEILRVQENEASERKYWEGGEHSLRQLSYWIAELKKKYVGE